MSEPRRAGERRERALHAPLPAVRARERACFIRVRGGESSDATKPLAFSGGLSDVPGEVGERAPTRPPLNVGRLEPGAYLVVEGTRLSRPALVVCRLTDQDEQLPRARAGRVEEVPVARDRVRPRKAAASPKPCHSSSSETYSPTASCARRSRRARSLVGGASSP